MPQCWDTPPLGADTPQEQRPPQSRHPPSRHPRTNTPQSRHPPEQTPPISRHPPSSDTPQQIMLGDTVNARAVRILLECNLVSIGFCPKWIRTFIEFREFRESDHWNMNWVQFKDPVYHMCLASTVVASWFLTQEETGLNPFDNKYFYHWIQRIHWKHLGKTQLFSILLVPQHPQSQSRVEWISHNSKGWKRQIVDPKTVRFPLVLVDSLSNKV